MQEKVTDNNIDLTATFSFFRKWWKLLTLVFIAATIISVVASLMVTPRYKSTAVLFPTSSNRLSKAIMDYHYSLDFMDYGIERDCEYAIQVLSSGSMEEAVCQRFNLMEHYGIATSDPHCKHLLHLEYKGNITIRRTEFLGVEIGVLDTDPLWAANIANFIASYYDTLCHNIHQDRAKDASLIMAGVCDSMAAEIHSLEEIMATDPKHKLSTQQLIDYKCEQLADIQTRAIQTAVDLNQNASYKFWLDKATPADKKAYPKRAIIVLLGAFGSLIMCIFVLLLVGRVTPKEEE